jgi:hypothetical protein
MCGRWFLLAFCCACGGNKMIETEDQERTIDELKAFFYSLFSWTAAFLALLVISFNDFLILFSSHS